MHALLSYALCRDFVPPVFFSVARSELTFFPGSRERMSSIFIVGLFYTRAESANVKRLCIIENFLSAPRVDCLFGPGIYIDTAGIIYLEVLIYSCVHKS